jgi:peptidoglycan/LPS O-acetylase OafA/YrhL
VSTRLRADGSSIPLSPDSQGAPPSAPRTREHRLPFRPDIEGLRAVAILFVVLFHTGWSAFGGGFFGVDVFFVLSGFLITGLIVEEIERTGTLSLSSFWARRARRLLPAAIVVTLFVLVANVVVDVSLFLQVVIGRSAMAFAAYGSNILYAVRSADYFGTRAVRDPLLHTWSLSVEEQFYLFFAPMMLLLAAWTRRRGPGTFRARVVPVLAVLSGLSLLGCLALVRRYPVIAFYVLPPRAWQFGVGALACFTLARAKRVDSRVLEIVSLLAFVGLLVSATVLREGRVASLGLATLVPTISTAALVLAGAGSHGTVVAHVLSTAPLRLIGRLSYSWYLWHWPFMVYLREFRYRPSLQLSLGVALLSLVPAAATYYFVESPIRYSPRLPRRPRLVLSGALAASALTFLTGWAAVGRANSVLSSPRVAKVFAARAKPRIYADGCVIPLLAVTPRLCEYGPATNDTSIVLFGDSHAAHWFPAFEALVQTRGWKLVDVTKLSCPSTSVSVTNMGRRYFECDEWRPLAIREIVGRHPTIVVVVDDKTYDVVLGDRTEHADTSVAAQRAWHDGLVRTIDALRPSGARILMLADTPHPVGDVPQCLVKHIDEQGQCDLPRSRSLNAAAAELERQAAEDAGKVGYLNLTEYICDRTTCPAARDGIIRYADSNHLSVAFSTSLAPYLSDQLTRELDDSP